MRRKAIVLVAYDRPDYLKRVIEGVRKMQAVEDYDLFASIDRRSDDTYNRDVVALCSGFDINTIVRSHHLGCNAHVRKVLLTTYLAGYQEIFYLEDDTVPAADALQCCQQLLPTLSSDPRIKAITLLGDNHGDLHVAWRNRHGFKAVRWFNPWGVYWTSDRLKGVLDQWPQDWDTSTATWDTHLNDRFLDGEWLALSPLLSRVQNIGRRGEFTKTEAQHQRSVRDFWSGDDLSKPSLANFR